MEKFVKLLEKYLGPIASKIENQRHVQSIKNGMMSLISILMVGSFTLVLLAIGQMFPQNSGVYEFFSRHEGVLSLPFNFTFGLLALYCAVTVSYNHAKQLKIPETHAVLGGLLTTLMLNVKIIDGSMNIEFLDSRGLFVALFASLITVEIMAYFLKNNITIRFEGLPELISQTFRSIIPLITVLSLALVVKIVIHETTGGLILPEAFIEFLAPSLQNVDTVWAVMLISFLEMLFWFVGLNGYAVLVGFVMPFMTQYLAANAAAYQLGEAIPHVFVPTYWDYFLAATGSGLTGALVFLAMFSRNKELKSIGRASIVPSIMTISEPIVFGLPVAFNPYFFVPFVLGTPLIGAISFTAFKSGIVRAPILHVGGTPVVLAQYLTTMDWKAVVLFFVIMLLAVGMYYPFFKMYERSLVVKDEEKAERQVQLDSLELDF